MDEATCERTAHFSVTQAEMVLRCPVQWWWRYRLGRKTPPGWALVGGRALDETLNHHHELRIGGSTDPYLLDYYSTKLSELTTEMEPEGEEDYDYAGLGPLAVAEYLRVIDPHLHPVEVQTKIKGETPDGVPILGYIDLIHSSSGARVIADHKFSGRKKVAKGSNQLTTYDHFKGDGGHHVQMITVVKNKRPKIEVDNAFITEAETAATMRTLHSAWSLTRLALEKDDPRYLAMAAPDSWVCSPKWCGYYADCRGSHLGVPLFETTKESKT